MKKFSWLLTAIFLALLDGAEAQQSKDNTRIPIVMTSIPIVMITGIDPVENGWIANLAHPGGNITGLATLIRT